MKRTIKSINPLQCGKILGAIYGAFSLLLLPLFIVIALMSLLTEPSPGTAAPAFVFTLILLGFGIVAPIFYAVMGFVTGLVGAWLFNVAARFVGGVPVEFD